MRLASKRAASAVVLVVALPMTAFAQTAQPAPPWQQQQQQQQPYPPQAQPQYPQGQPYMQPSAPPPRQTHSSTILGQELVNGDDDTDIAIGRATITSADPSRRDVIESRPEERREVEGKRVTAAPLFGYATNDLNLGVGARAGYTFDVVPFYVGGSFLYHTGETTDASAPGTADVHKRFVIPAAEVGYDFGIGPLLARPYVGGGLLLRRTSVDAVNNLPATANTDSAFLLYPGATVQYFIARTPVFVGGDTRVYIPFAKEGAALGLMATAGLSL